MKKKLSIVVMSIMLILSGCGSSSSSGTYATDNMIATESFNEYNYDSYKSYDNSYDDSSNISYNDKNIFLSKLINFWILEFAYIVTLGYLNIL